MTERIGQQLGNYRLVKLLGSGGFADTYLGEHTYLKTFAALKILQAKLGKLEMDSFYNEARIIARLKHPNIVHVLDFGVGDNVPYLIMEYAPRGTLRQLHPRHTPLSLPAVVPYVRQLASALQYAHEHKIVHRDVKPENMLLGSNHEMLLSDFGIAMIAQTRAQNPQTIAGTVTYMAPEQIQGKPCPASDQYALAIVIYEWLCGMPPFGGTYTEVALQHECVMPPPMCEQIASIPLEVEEVVLTALAKDPTHRFRNVQQFAQAFEEACRLDDWAISASPLSLPGGEADPQFHVPTEINSNPGEIMAEHRYSPQILAAYNRRLHENSTPQQEKHSENEKRARLTSEPLDEFISLNLPTDASVLPKAKTTIFLSSISAEDGLNPEHALPQYLSQNPYALLLLPAASVQMKSNGVQISTKGAFAPHAPYLDRKRPLLRMLAPTTFFLLLLLLAVLLGGFGLLYMKSEQSSSNLSLSQSTAVARARNSARQLLYQEVTGSTPSLNAPLTNPDSFGWLNGDFAKIQDNESKHIGSCKFTGDDYISNASPGYFVSCMASNTHFRNMGFQVEMKIKKGHSAGIVIRGDGSDAGYYFRISTDGAYVLQKIRITGDESGGSEQIPLISGTSSIIKKGLDAENLLTIIARDHTLYLYVNGQFLDDIVDKTYDSGRIGVYTDSDQDSVEASFRNAKVWKLPDDDDDDDEK